MSLLGSGTAWESSATAGLGAVASVISLLSPETSSPSFGLRLSSIKTGCSRACSFSKDEIRGASLGEGMGPDATSSCSTVSIGTCWSC
ncbi:hypothetical protein BJY04DRAFT_202348 [Aspergillus karnatakaensis]|uniref:uncharacterized protein n=1 Tax=Aspergillus karnatakaensis TaxID=1810916 RepID=UPI003CCD96BE